MSKLLDEIEEQLANALRENDFDTFVSQCTALWKFAYSFAFKYLSCRIGDGDTEELADAAMLEVIEEIRRKAGEGRFRINQAGEPEVYFVRAGKWASFSDWLKGVVRNVCRRKLREWWKYQSQTDPLSNLTGRERGGNEVSMVDVLSDPDMNPLQKYEIEIALQNWVMDIVTDLGEFAEHVGGRMWNVAKALIDFIRWKISQFIVLPLPDEEWREFDHEKLMHEADMIQFRRKLLTDSGSLGFDTTEVWDWIQDELKLKRPNRDKLKQRFTDTLQPMLFSIEPEFQVDLDNGDVSERLRKAFQDNGFSLPQNATVSTMRKNSRWLIADQDERQKYSIRKEKDKLEVCRVTLLLEKLWKAGLL